MQRTTFNEMACPIGRTLDIIGEWWTPLVLRDIALGISRFDAIQRDLGISRKVLTQRLETLVAHDVVQRIPYQDNPPRFDYFLTEKGAELAMVLVAMQSWGDKWIFDGKSPGVQWRHTTCGEISAPALTCGHCHEPVSPANAMPVRGPAYDAEAVGPEIDAAIDRWAAALSG